MRTSYFAHDSFECRLCTSAIYDDPECSDGAKFAGCQVAYPWAECVRWARMVGQEFAAQVAKEKEAGLTVSVFMDVHGDVQLAKLQARNPIPA